MIQIKISNTEGYYYINNNELIYSYGYNEDEVQVSDLTDLTVYQYNQLVMSINGVYPDYDIKELKGRFI